MEELRRAIAHAGQQALTLHEQGKTSEAAETAAWAAQYAREHLPPGDELRRRSTLNAATLEQLIGDYDKAVVLYGEAADLADTTADVRTLAHALNGLLAIHGERNEHEAAARAGERALTLWRNRRGTPTADVLTLLSNVAQMHYRSGAAERAASLMEEVITHRQTLFPEDTPALALALLNLGTVRESQGDFVAAESHMLSALAMRRQAFPLDDPAIMEAVSHLSGLYEAQEDYRRAIPYQQEALAIVKRRGAEPLALARTLNNLATLYYRVGDFAGSKPLYEEALALMTRVHGKQHRDTTAGAGNLANALRRLADFDGAERLLREVIATRRELEGDGHGTVAIAIDDLTEVFREKGSVADLERYYCEVLDIVLGHADDPRILTSSLLRSLITIERAHSALAPNRPRSLAQAEAERLHKESKVAVDFLAGLMYHLKEGRLAAQFFSAASARKPRESREWSLALQGLAASYLLVDDRVRAASVCDNYVAAVRAGWHAPPHDYAMVLWTQSQVLEVNGDAKAAIVTMRESLTQMELAASSGIAVNLAGALLRLAELYLSAGEFASARKFATCALEQTQATGGSVTSARARAVLARRARTEGRLVEAESLFRAALPPLLAIEPDWKTVLLLRDFGLLYTSCHDVTNGVPLIQRAIAMAKELYGNRSWQYATMLVTLAEVKSWLGPLNEAAPLFVEVAEVADEIGSPELLARALGSSGALYTRIGATDAAKYMLRRALTTMARYRSSTEEIAMVETNLAMNEARSKNYDEASERIDRVIATLRQKGIGGAPLAHATRTRMWILGHMQRWDEAFEAARVTSDALENSLEQSISVAPSSGREQVADDLYGQLDVVLSLAQRLRTPAAVVDACDRTLRWKGAALTWGASHVQALAASTVAELKALRRDFIQVRREIIRRSLSDVAISEMSSTALEELHRRQEALDREVARHLSSTPGLVTKAPLVNVQVVSTALPADGVLIDFVRYESIDFDRGAPADRLHRGTYRYAAFVVRADARPTLVDIGDADVVDGAVNRFRSSITGEADAGGIPRVGDEWTDDQGGPKSSESQEAPPEDDWIAAGRDLRQLVFDPLLDAIGPCTRLTIAPHGELTRLPFAALPGDNGCLIDHYEVTYLDTGLDLLRSRPNVSVPGPPLVMAYPDFDVELQTVAAGDRVRPFDPLDGTREEGTAVAALLGVAPIMGTEATDARLWSVQSPRILHIATHGFFLVDDRPPRSANVHDAVTMIAIPGFGNYAVQFIDKPREIDDGENIDRLTRLGRLADPMLRSGLAVAGSNTWASGAMLSTGDDGLLTAAEIALLDLTSTDLAVLSACETGLGEVRRGEGVFGLRRAFAIAGARTLVMSVWNLSDVETSALMVEFYREVTKGKPFAQALRNAQQHVRKTAPQPVHWAGLLLIGN